MPGRWDYPSYEPTRRRPAAGIRAKSQRGAIGQTWWSRRFIGVLESFNMGARLGRGRSYARSGQVLDLEVSPGLVTARVQGSRVRPYKVSIALKTLSERDWRRAEDTMASQALFLAMLLAGEMPLDIEEAFGLCRLSLFPAAGRDLVTECSCPDYANPCKHIAATYYLLAESFDDDPFLIFVWRGRPKEALMGNLRLLRSDGDAAPETGAAPSEEFLTLEEAIDDFWLAGPDLAGLRIHPQAAPVPEGLLRQLDPLDLGLGADLVEALVSSYRVMSAEAERRALGQPAAPPVRPPRPRSPAASPGRRSGSQGSAGPSAKRAGKRNVSPR